MGTSGEFGSSGETGKTLPPRTSKSAAIKTPSTKARHPLMRKTTGSTSFARCLFYCSNADALCQHARANSDEVTTIPAKWNDSPRIFTNRQPERGSFTPAVCFKMPFFASNRRNSCSGRCARQCGCASPRRWSADGDHPEHCAAA